MGTTSIIKMKLSISYASANPLKEGDRISLPAYISDYKMNNFSSKSLKDGFDNEIGKWEYAVADHTTEINGYNIKNSYIPKTSDSNGLLPYSITLIASVLASLGLFAARKRIAR